MLLTSAVIVSEKLWVLQSPVQRNEFMYIELNKHYTDQDLKIMIEASKEAHGDDEVAVARGVISQIEYAEMVSNL
jgi:hypothetical protein